MKDEHWDVNGIKHISKEVRSWVRDNYDVVMVITSYEGKGKSTLEMEFGEEIDENFEIERNLLLSTSFKAIRSKLDSLPKYSVVGYDEAVKQFHKFDWSKSIQQVLLKYFTLKRKDNKVHILCIPSFMDLTKTFRERRVFIWIHILSRGLAVYMKSIDNSPFYCWYVDEIETMMKERARQRKSTTTTIPDDDMIDIMSKSIHFVCAFPFPQLDPEKERKYLEYVAKYSEEGLYEDEDNKEFHERYSQVYLRFGNLIDKLKNGLIKKSISIAEIGRMINCPARTLEEYRKKYADSLLKHTHTPNDAILYNNIQKTNEIPSIHTEQQNNPFVAIQTEEAKTSEEPVKDTIDKVGD